jgi:hypothetical protein
MAHENKDGGLAFPCINPHDMSGPAMKGAKARRVALAAVFGRPMKGGR